MRTPLIAALMAIVGFTSAARAAELDDWCAQVTRPSSIVICADPDLRHLTVLRQKVFDDAQRDLDPDQYEELLDNQKRWIKTYTSNCGVSVDGPPVAVPVPENVIGCYKNAGRDRLAWLISYMTQEVPGYTPPSMPTQIDQDRQAAREQAAKTEAAEKAARAAAAEEAAEEAAKAAAQAKADEERRQAEKAREQLRAQAIAERGQKIAAKLNELGFQVISPIDLELDWRELAKSSKKVALWGIYARVDDVDGLAVDNKDQPVIRLYTDGASRNARKAMLECRDGDSDPLACRMVIGGTVQSCIVNKEKINEREVPCVAALEAFVLPEGWQPATANQH